MQSVIVVKKLEDSVYKEDNVFDTQLQKCVFAWGQSKL